MSIGRLERSDIYQSICVLESEMLTAEMAGSGEDEITKEFILGLIRQKDDIEGEIKQHQNVLIAQNNVGMHDPLVDDEGYPRSDIDVCAVRHARNRIICLQNDHKDIVDKIEKGLHVLHARERVNSASSNEESKNLNSPTETPKEASAPFAKVESISPGSPASDAGLLVDDLIVEFGSVNLKNFSNLQNIAAVVQHSVARPVNIRVRRGNTDVHLGLIPKQWSGRGLLGCSIVPISR